MTDAADNRLDALFAADAAPEHDRAFEAVVVARVEERRSLLRWAWIAAYAVVGVVCTFAALPALVEAFGLDVPAQVIWSAIIAVAVPVVCVASVWRYLKPLLDWRLLTAWM